MPLFPPVTSATFPSSFPIAFLLILILCALAGDANKRFRSHSNSMCYETCRSQLVLPLTPPVRFRVNLPSSSRAQSRDLQFGFRGTRTEPMATQPSHRVGGLC